MTKVPAFRIGDYGDGTIGFKTAILPNNVLTRADDFDVTKRSFNSEWPNVMKIRQIGVVQSVAQQWQGTSPQGNSLYYASGWRWLLPQVPTGLTYIPIWEERRYDSTSSTFYDDDAALMSNYVYTGARSWFVRSDTTVDMGRTAQVYVVSPPPITYPANTLVFDPNFMRSENPGVLPLSNTNFQTGYPVYPPMPAPSAKAAYVMYSNSTDPSVPA